MQSWLKNLGLEGLKLPPLKVGAHKRPEDGLCAMEMVAFIERLPHSDRPACTSPVVASLVIFINDSLSDDGRQALLPWLPRVVGTVAPEFERARSYAIIQAVFDLVACLDRPRLLDRHMHDPATGRRCALPPWDYGRDLARAKMQIEARMDAATVAWVETADHLLEALTETKPAAAATHALHALPPLKYAAHRQGHWAREPVFKPVEPLVVTDGAIQKLTVEHTIVNYAPDWARWPFQLLEHVLAIGPKAGGWTRNGVEVAHRVERLAEMV